MVDMQAAVLANLTPAYQALTDLARKAFGEYTRSQYVSMGRAVKELEENGRVEKKSGGRGLPAFVRIKASSNIVAPDWYTMAGWTPGAGPVPGVWLNKNAGQRCVWTCRWMTSRGLINPEQWPSRLPEGMPLAAVYWELCDLVSLGRNAFTAQAAQILVQPGVGPDAEFWPPELRPLEVVRQARASYPEYLWPAGLPPFQPPPREKIYAFRYRPGWGE